VIAELLTIGDELLRGEIVDTNAAFLADRLVRLEVETRFHTTVRDDPADMTDAFRRAVRRSDLVLVSGGLGPTRDDLTVAVLAAAFGRKLQLHEPSLAAIEAFFARFDREMAENNRKQALLPSGAAVLPNPLGTAPGCLLEEEGTLFFCMPGVPRELIRMMDEQVMPRIRERVTRSSGEVVRAALLRTFGMGESNLDQELRDLAQDPHLALGFRTAFPDNYLRPLARGGSEAEAEERLAGLIAAIEERLGALVYGRGDETLEAVVGRLLDEAGKRLAVAESCTGGLLAERITSVAGASTYFLGGAVAYADEAKERLLGVPSELLRQRGAVSEPVARAMAQGALERFGADYALSTTGISGPGGGSEEKPVGLVYVGFASAQGVSAHELLLPFDRQRHRIATTQVALDQLRRTLLGVEIVVPRSLRRLR